MIRILQTLLRNTHPARIPIWAVWKHPAGCREKKGGHDCLAGAFYTATFCYRLQFFMCCSYAHSWEAAGLNEMLADGTTWTKCVQTLILCVGVSHEEGVPIIKH